MISRLARRGLTALASPITLSVPAVDLVIQKKATPVAVRNIYCIGRNYVKHAHELGNEVPESPVVFLKSSASLRGLEPQPDALAFSDENFHHEVEMVLLVGRDVPLGGLTAGAEEACVEAIGLGLDLTRRETQTALKSKGLPWTTAKSFAGSAIVGPFTSIAGLDESFALREVAFDLRVNGELRQAGRVEHMIFDVPSQLRYLNSLAPLLRGDLVFTGTPEGVATLRRGDSFEMRFTGPEPLCKACRRISFKGSL